MVRAGVEVSSSTGLVGSRGPSPAIGMGFSSGRRDRSTVAGMRLTIYLLRDVAAPRDALDLAKSVSSIPLDAGAEVDGVFYYQSRPRTTPGWVGFVRPLLASAPPALTSASVSGLVVVKARDRYFALTFGYGRSFLNPAKVEHRFGLRVALNRIDPNQIRSLDTKTFEDMVVTRNTQVSKSAELPTFGVDVSRDILRAVTGEPRDQTLAKRLSGSDALVVNTDIGPNELTKFCGELLLAYREETYKANFGWIDQLRLVEDGTQIDRLNAQLVAQLRTGDTSSTHMATPEAISWEDVDTFRIGGTRALDYDDLDLDEYMGKLGATRAAITLEKLRSRRVSVRFSRSNDFDSRWSLYQCLISEQRLDSQLHVLIEGRWFAISDSLVAEVDHFTATLPARSTPLPPALPGEIEGDYNRRVATTSPADFLLLDAQIRRPGGASSGIELCDLLASSGEFLHIKRKSRSSTLSHLFAQGTISATTFIQDGAFRDQIREVIDRHADRNSKSRWLSLVPGSNESVDRSRYVVSYAVITNAARSENDWLPFFSKLNLMQAARQLSNLGFQLYLTRVSIDDSA